MYSVTIYKTNRSKAICDPGDEVIVFKPYYFNNLMALQMANVDVVYAPTDENYFPILDQIPFTKKTKMMVIQD